MYGLNKDYLETVASLVFGVGFESLSIEEKKYCFERAVEMTKNDCLYNMQ